MKHCYRCKAFKSEGEFYRCRSKPDGLSSECRPCKRDAEAGRRSRSAVARGIVYKKSVPKKMLLDCGVEVQRCCRCRLWLPSAAFGKRAGSECLSCHCAAQRSSEKRGWQKLLERSTIYRRKPANAQKVWARRTLNNAIRDGRVSRGSCENCGAAETQGHHERYDDAFAVRWLCRACHVEHHGEVR